MAAEGDTKTKFGRQYVFLNPDATVGPGAWRLSSIDEIAGVDPGSGGINDIDGISPITSTAVGIGEVDIGLDISNLPEK